MTKSDLSHICGRKQIIQTLNHKPRLQSRSEEKSTQVTKQEQHYSPQQTSQIYHPPRLQRFSERQMFDPSQAVIHQPVINHPSNVNLEFAEGQDEQNIGTNSPYQK